MGWVLTEGDIVARAGFGAAPRAPDLVHDGIVAPGLVDLQVNGAAGTEVTGGAQALDQIERTLLRHGVTRCLATVLTCPPEVGMRVMSELEARVADPDSPIVGVHLEGPFLSAAHAGIHRPELLRAPADGLPSYYDSSAVRLVTLAPELPGAPELIAELRSRRVAVGLGHSGASAAQASAAFAGGARIVTHLFNAMAPLHHREPGLAGAALGDARVWLGTIADGVHLHPLMLSLVHRLAARRVVLVSDASPLAGGDGTGAGELGGVAVVPGADGAPRDGGGRLAGSGILLDEAVQGWARFTGATLAEALAAGSERPARALGLPAGLEPGAPADLLLLDREAQIQRVMRSGRWLADG